jgi:hypothetical protein
MSSENAFQELLKHIADYFNKNVTEVDASKIAFFIKQYVDTLPITKVEIVKEIQRIYVPAFETKVVTRIPENTEKAEFYMGQLAENICDAHGIKIYELKRGSGKVRQTRLRKYVDARQEFANIACAAGITKVEIGKFLGYTEHSSVVHLINYRSQQKSFA